MGTPDISLIYTYFLDTANGLIQAEIAVIRLETAQSVVPRLVTIVATKVMSAANVKSLKRKSHATDVVRLGTSLAIVPTQLAILDKVVDIVVAAVVVSVEAVVVTLVAQVAAEVEVVKNATNVVR